MKYSQKLLEIYEHNELSTLITNLNTTFIEYKQNGMSIIATITDEVVRNVYVVSPYALMIDYGTEELEKIKSPTQKVLFFLLIEFFSIVLKLIKIDKVQILNNYLFSTNFFTKSWETLEINVLRKDALNAYPKHSLLIRSVNQIQNPKLYKNLLHDGWKAIALRQVYIYDNKEKWQKARNTKNDKKLLSTEQFIIRKSVAYERAIELYNTLYLSKHSKHNIHYTSSLLEQLVKKGLLKLFFLQDTKTQVYVGVVGVTEEDSVITVPIIGYDCSYSQEDALYRRLVYYVTAYAFEKNALLNFSSGAPDFKTKRGAKPVLEYMFVYDRHLSLPRRAVWKSIALLAKYVYAPMLQRLKL
jgi:hypothetical protein